ncbi:MAG: hypothetical protein RL072_225 [Actinomycetota bacterium]|jgi:hypothetical protein
MNIRPKALTALLAAILIAPLASSSAASAAVAVSLSKQISLVDGEKISVTLAGIPATQGVYIQQCYQPKVGQRAATGLLCNGSLQQTEVMVWATMDGARGSQPASAPLTFTVRENVTVGSQSYECGPWNCFLFVYRDHRGLSDTSLDTITPLVFLAPQELKMRSFGLPKDGASVRKGATLNLQNDRMVTEQGVDARGKSLTPDVCTVTRGRGVTSVRFVNRGTCTLRFTAKGDAVYKQLVEKVTYAVS